MLGAQQIVQGVAAQDQQASAARQSLLKAQLKRLEAFNTLKVSGALDALYSSQLRQLRALSSGHVHHKGLVRQALTTLSKVQLSSSQKMLRGSPQVSLRNIPAMLGLANTGRAGLA
jgi:hypothetical protein